MEHLTKAACLELCRSFAISPHEFFILLKHAANRDFLDLLMYNKIDITKDQFFTLHQYLNRRQSGEPIAKIVGNKEFYGFNFMTTEHTLDPRPETELLIDLFLKYFPDHGLPLHILDLGCGTGCVGLTILKLFPNIQADLCDISTQAIEIAKKNAINLKVSERCCFIRSNWFQNISQKYDAILANPPYIAENFELDQSVKFDPPEALFSGPNGMTAITQILSQGHRYLASSGYLFLEIGFDQKDKVLNIEHALDILEIARDMQGIERSVVFTNRAEPSFTLPSHR